ncbi:MAG: radical SAM protein [Desulfobacteraceae bacterium]|jgi:radical SAM superfamily enzyme YgiQ (UPF0313 family)
MKTNLQQSHLDTKGTTPADKKRKSDLNSIVLLKIWQGSKDRELAPLGLLFIGNELRKEGYQVYVYQWDKHNAMQNLEIILDHNPFLVGFSMITGDPMQQIIMMSEALKEKMAETSIVYGGVHPTLEPKQCLAEKSVDFIVTHEGEAVIAQLANAIRDKKDPSNIKGIGFKKNGQIVINEFPDFQKDLDKYEMDWSLIDIEKYIWSNYHGENRVLMGYVASRGCPHNCAFCHNLVFNRRTYRKPSAKKVIDDVNRLSKKNNFDGIVFYDDNFTVNKKWSLEVIKGIQLEAFHVETRIDYITEEYIQEMYEAGVRSFFLGVESGSDRILKLLCKGFKKEKIIESLLIMDKYPIDVKISLIVGVPTESIQEYKETLKFIDWSLSNLKRIDISFGSYLPFPGTPLYNLCLKRGFEKPKSLVEWGKLDRWGNQNLAIPWTEGIFLTSLEVKKVRNIIEKIVDLKKKNQFWSKIQYTLLRMRILISGSKFIFRLYSLDSFLIRMFGIKL